MKPNIYYINSKDWSNINCLNNRKIRNNLYLEETQNNSKHIKITNEDNNNKICEELTCSRQANSKLSISLKSGTIVFFNLCEICKRILKTELESNQEIRIRRIRR